MVKSTLACLVTLVGSAAYSAVTAVDTSDLITFLSIGDWGQYDEERSEAMLEGNSDSESDINEEEVPGHLRRLEHVGVPREPGIYQIDVAKAMNDYAANSDTPLDYIISVGDNFYDTGIADANDNMWHNVWRHIYFHYGPYLEVPWHPVFGNHDYGHGVRGLAAQIERTTATDDDEVFARTVWW